MKRKLPFNCTILDEQPVYVTNPFSGEGIMLEPDEVAVYDTMKGAELFGDWETVQDGIDWFIKYNSKAYMVLLD